MSQSSFLTQAEGNARKLEVAKFKEATALGLETNLKMLENVAGVRFAVDTPEHDQHIKDAQKVQAQYYSNEIDKYLNATAPDGSLVLTPTQKIAYQDRLNKTKVSGYKNNLDKMYLSNPNSAMEYIETTEADPTGFQKKEGLSRSEYDTIKSYNDSFKTLTKKKKGTHNPNTGKPYTEEELVAIQNDAFAVTTEHEAMDIKSAGKKGEASEVKIMNKEYDNVRSLVTFKDNLDESFKHGGTTEDKAKTWGAETDAILLQKLRDNDVDFKTMWGTTVEEHMAKTAVEYNGLNDRERVLLFRNVYQDALTEGIDLGDDRRSSRQKVQKLIEDNAKDIQRMQYTTIRLREPAKVITDYGLADYSSDPETGGINVDGKEDGEIMIFNGEKWRITRDRFGFVHRSKVE